MTFGQLLLQHLARHERSASWLAERLDLYPSTVTRWLNEESRPRDLHTVIRIADVLSIHAADERRTLVIAAGYAYVESPRPPPDETTPVAAPATTLPPSPSEATAQPTTRSTDPTPPAPSVSAQNAPGWLRTWLRWEEAPDDARTSWAGMIVYLLRRLANAQAVYWLQMVLVTMALWLAASWLLTPILAWPLDDLRDRRWATACFALGSWALPPFVALATRPDGLAAFAPTTVRGGAVLWFLKLAGAYVGFGSLAGLAVAFAFLWRQVTGAGLPTSLCWALAFAPLLFSHIGARRIPYDRYRLYGRLQVHQADRLFLPIYIGFGPLLALFVFLAYPWLTNPLVGFATLVSLISLIWWERRVAH